MTTPPEPGTSAPAVAAGAQRARPQGERGNGRQTRRTAESSGSHGRPYIFRVAVRSEIITPRDAPGAAQLAVGVLVVAGRAGEPPEPVGGSPCG